MNMRILPLPLLAALGLAACDSPSLPMMSAPVTRLQIAGAEFTVRHDGQRAEAVRTSRMSNPDLWVMLALSKRAIEQASGCAVRPGTLYGDRVMAEAFLDCPGRDGAHLQSPVIFLPAGGVR